MAPALRDHRADAGPRWHRSARATGATPCAGSVGGKNLTGWVWATDAQVLDLLDDYEPTLSATNPSVSGPAVLPPRHQLPQRDAVDHHRVVELPHQRVDRRVDGLDRRRRRADRRRRRLLSHPIFTGQLGIAAGPRRREQRRRGVFLWRTCRVSTTRGRWSHPIVTGTLGSNGWYVSDVSVHLGRHRRRVGDRRRREGCGPASVAADTAGRTFTCTATSAGSETGDRLDRRSSATRHGPDPDLCSRRRRPSSSASSRRNVLTATVTDATSRPAVGRRSSGVANTATAGVVHRPRSIGARPRRQHARPSSCAYNVVAAVLPRADRHRASARRATT